MITLQLKTGTIKSFKASFPAVHLLLHIYRTPHFVLPDYSLFCLPVSLRVYLCNFALSCLAFQPPSPSSPSFSPQPSPRYFLCLLHHVLCLFFTSIFPSTNNAFLFSRSLCCSTVSPTYTLFPTVHHMLLYMTSLSLSFLLSLSLSASLPEYFMTWWHSAEAFSV